MNGGARPVDDTLVNLALIAIAGLGLAAAVLPLAGTVAAWVIGAEQPDPGWSAGFRVLGHPSDPGRAPGAQLSARSYRLVLVLMPALRAPLAIVLWRRT